VRGQGKALRLDHAGSRMSRRGRCDFGSSTTDPPVTATRSCRTCSVGPPPVARGVGQNIMSDHRRDTGARRREGDEPSRLRIALSDIANQAATMCLRAIKWSNRPSPRMATSVLTSRAPRRYGTQWKSSTPRAYIRLKESSRAPDGDVRRYRGFVR
jgi:hypothetical protein